MARKFSLCPQLYAVANETVGNRYMAQIRERDRAPVETDESLPRFTLVVDPSPFAMPRGWEFFLTSPHEGAAYISTEMCLLFNNAPKEARAVHPFEVGTDGSVRDRWRWCVYSVRKPLS